LSISNPRHNLVSIRGCVELEALRVTSEQVYEEVHYGWLVIDNKDTNIWSGAWIDRQAILSAEARQLREFYATVSHRNPAGQEPSAANPMLQGRDRDLTVMGNLCSGQA
jgi:hypothetical protein